MKQKNVVFDLDDTLLDFKTQIMNSIHQEHDMYHHWSTWKDYNLFKTYDLTSKQLRDTWVKHKCIQNADVFPYARQVLIEAKERGFNVVLVTARGWHPNGDKLTAEWLKRYDMPYDDLVVTMPGQNKMKSLTGYDSFEFGIDDHVRNCVDFRESGKFKKVYLINAPWNQHLDANNPHGIERIYCLNDLFKMMERGI